jgi:hypothetical protein
MFLNFAAALATLGPDSAFRFANAARPTGAYLLNSILPEENRATYHIEGGSMTVRPTMAGLVGMDSPYPPGGMVSVSSFLEKSAKVANEVALSEEVLRTLQDMLMRLGQGGGGDNEALADEALNFFELVVLQPHFDTFEWLRGQVLQFGQIDWTYNKKRLLVNYGVDPSHFLPERTGTAGYAGTASEFWNDVRTLRRRVGRLRVMLAHPDTMDAIAYNPANNLAVTGENGNAITVRRFALNSQGDPIRGQFSEDSRDQVTILTYDREGEVLNPADTSETIKLPFLSRGKLIAIGDNAQEGYRPGQGAVEEDLDRSNRLGYTHIAPTVEGGGSLGRWGDMYVPEARPWSLHGRAVTNGLPVLEAPEKLAVATTEVPS